MCGSKRNIDVEHIDGHEENSEPANLMWACRSCNVLKANTMRKAGKGRLTNQYNPAGGAKTLGQWLTAVQSMKGESNAMSVDDAVAMIRATSQRKRSEFARDIWSKRKERGNPSAAQLKECLFGKSTGKRKNPATVALEAYEDFHGRESAELIEVRDTMHYHKYLASAGELRRLVVRSELGDRVVLSGFKGALLCFNEAGNQLFVRGGDQSVDLKQFGIKSPHEVETLGKAVEIDYKTVKDHLGDEGGDAVYRHKFRQTNQDGKHVTLRVAKFPDVIYRVRDKQLEFSGGSYVIRAEGIDK